MKMDKVVKNKEMSALIKIDNKEFCVKMKFKVEGIKVKEKENKKEKKEKECYLPVHLIITEIEILDNKMDLEEFFEMLGCLNSLVEFITADLGIGIL